MKLGADGWWVPDWVEGSPVEEQAFDVRVVEAALPFARARRLAVQGGARVGLWPVRLARYFQRVVAFEPEPQNFECCTANCAGLSQVKLHRAALWNRNGTAKLVVDAVSDGLHRIDFAGDIDVPVVSIDSLELPACDAIFIDVEGCEMKVLEGARLTIERFAPVIVAEENELCRRFGSEPGAIERALRPLAYKVRGRYGRTPATRENPFPGWDLILCAD